MQQTVTTLAQMIPVIVLSGAVVGIAKQAIPREQAAKSFSEVSLKDANETVGSDNVNVACKNPDTIFYTDRGEILYTGGMYFIR